MNHIAHSGRENSFATHSSCNADIKLSPASAGLFRAGIFNTETNGSAQRWSLGFAAGALEHPRAPCRARGAGSASPSCLHSLSCVVGGCRLIPLKESADCIGRCIGQAPSRGNPVRLVSLWPGELSVLIKRRHPEVQAEIDRVYQERLAQLSKRQRDSAMQDN